MPKHGEIDKAKLQRPSGPVLGNISGMFALVDPKGKAHWAMRTRESCLSKFMQEQYKQQRIVLSDADYERAEQLLKTKLWTIRPCRLWVEEVPGE